jgi:Fe-S-cluster-containing dehydrogenase component
VLACPFGVPKYYAELDQMMKCDMCLDRTSEGLKPMCASVCPSEALWYGTFEDFNRTRHGSLLRDFLFGAQEVRTKVYTVVDDLAEGPLDVLRGTRTTWLDDPFGLDAPGDAP